MTLDDLRRIMPHAGKRLDVFVDSLNDAMAEFWIGTPARQAAFLAQLAHESGEFRYMQEIADGMAYNGRKDLGNVEPEAIRIAAEHGASPGPWWKGHGPIQITGYANHKACGEALGLDLLNEPLLITEPRNGCRSAAWFWKSRGLNEIADAGDFQLITRRINGGLNGYSDRVAYHERAREVFA